MSTHPSVVLVTGGAGFIGRHVVAQLLREGYVVRILDSFVGSSRENIPANVSVFEGDIRDTEILAKALDGVDNVVHLAAQVSVPLSVEDPRTTYEVNVRGTQTLFELAGRAGVGRVVYASSAAVYGDQPELPKSEESPLEPKSPYATSKVENEKDARESGLSTLGLRFFNVYGIGQSANHPYASVMPRWVAAIRAGQPLQIYGDGTQTRDFVHVRDIARAIGLGLASSYQGVCNVASGAETSLVQVHQIFEEILGRVVPYEMHPARIGDIMRSVARVDRAQEQLQFIATTPLLDGIAELLQ